MSRRVTMCGGWWAAAVVAAAGLTGCQSGGVADARELRPWVDAEGHSRSVAFASPAHREAAAAADLPPGLPWFADRNDVQPSVTSGVQPVTLERSLTYTVDRQRSFRGRVFDSHSETTYRQEVTETWR
ncbi:MAG: hypothetical protein WD118_11170 [Phycisphaeraceae bacterium]